MRRTRIHSHRSGVTGPAPCLLASVGILLAVGSPVAAQTANEKAGLDLFEKSVRPLLSQRCYGCHNAGSGVLRGGLAVDTKDGLLSGGNHGAAIVPGNPDKSLLLKAIAYTDNNLQMPPGTKLPDDQVEAIRRWIQMGAPDPRVSAGGNKPKLTGLTDKAKSHWAFQPLKHPSVPTFKATDKLKTFVANPIDAFVLEKLEAKGLTPSPTASREALIRRVSYDLTGLPPTVEEVRAFLADRAPNAWEKVVDRLLASPHYGERWGRHWLDTARYSDTKGYAANNGKDKYDGYQYPYAWTYRDYVIDSMNEDKPYNLFILEQIAADKLPGVGPSDPRLAALGFLTVGKRFQNPDDTIDERIDTVTKATVGLTVSCARCHDHKFDPIPTADYYSLHGIFNSIVEPDTRPVVRLAGDSDQRSAFETKMDELLAQNRKGIYELIKTTTQEFEQHAEGYLMILSVPGRGTKSYDIAKKYGLWPLDREITANVRVNPLDPVLGPFSLLSRLPAERFAQTAPPMLARVLHDPKRPVNPLVVSMLEHTKLTKLEDAAKAYGLLFAQARKLSDAYFVAKGTPGQTAPVADPNMSEILDTPIAIPSAAELATREQQLAFFTERGGRKGRQMAGFTLVNGYKTNKLTFQEMNELSLTHPGAPGCAMVVKDADTPQDSYVYLRGIKSKKGPVVPRQFIEILSGPDRKPFTEGSGRLELAQAILSPRDPLPARVAVNRAWMYHFGEGFVSTPDDLGNQAETPSHPELMDWLSNWFISHNWSMKQLHRLILTSNTYKQSAATNAAYAVKDPGNRLLWRANLRRLDFEAIRDSLVMLTGKLDTSLGGKPVNITDEPYTYRRSCYGYVDRLNLSDLLTQFDFADPEMSNSRRITTIVPQQALFFLNSPMSVDVARQVMARPEVAQSTSDEEKVRSIYLILFQRSPKPAEIEWATDFMKQATQVATPAAVTNPNRKVPVQRPLPRKQGGRYASIKNEGLPVARTPLSGWELYVQALLCTNEFVYVN